MKSALFSDIKRFMKHKLNRIYVLQLFILILLSFSIVYQFYFAKKITNKIEHRYYNLTRSLEDIHGVEIETHKGRVVKK